MGGTWGVKKSPKLPEKFSAEYPGVRFYEHPSRKFKRRPDRYYTIRYRRQGKRIEEGVGWASEGWTAEEANRILGEIRKNIRCGIGPQSLLELARASQEAVKRKTALSFGELAERYIEWAKRNKKSWTEDNYRLKKRVLPFFGHRAAASITRTDVETFRDGLIDQNELSPASIIQYLAVFRRVYNWASHTPLPHDPKRMLHEERNPMDGVRLPLLDNERDRFLTREEAAVLLDAAKESMPDLHDIILLALLTGMRRQEVLGLTWQDVDLAHRVITIPASLTRTKKSRRAYLDDETTDMLQQRRAHVESPYIFPGLDGPRNSGHVTKQFDKLVNALGFNAGVTDRKRKVVFHTLRHTYASWLAQEGADIYSLMELTGHKTLAMARRYSHLMPERVRAVAGLVSRYGRRERVKVPPDPDEE